MKAMGFIKHFSKTEVVRQNLRITQLGKSGRIEEAIKTFKQIPHQCRNSYTFNSMISAYARNDRTREARELFDRMPLKNIVSYNAMINAYLQNDQLEEACQLFDGMPEERDFYTYALMITCYSRKGNLRKARALFEQKGGDNIACWNAMISGLVKSGKVSEAKRLFNEMPVKNVVSWNSMLSGYVHNGDMELGRKFFEEMDEKDTVSWNLMVEGFVEVGDLDSAWKYFDQNPCRNIVSWVAIFSGYAKYGRLFEARSVFNQMPDKNVVAWNAMIAAYVQNGIVDEAVWLFNQMPQRNAVSLTTMINGYVRVGKLEEAREMLNKMKFKNVGAQTAMISGYIQHNRMDEAFEIFDKIKVRDVVCWNTMIAGYAQWGRMNEASDLFKQMDKKNLVTWNTMIAGYAQSGQMGKAIEMFTKMKEKNLITWNSLISGYTKHGLYLDALKCFVLMLEDGRKPDQSTFASMLSACANLAADQMGNQLHQIAFKSGYLKDLVISNALITMYAKCGRISNAECVFSNIDVIDIISWNSLIAGYALNGYGQQAVEVFHDMEEEQVVPDEVTFVGLLAACNHSGLIDQGVKIYKCMTTKYSIEPLAEHYACMVDLLGRAGRLEEAFQLVKKMKMNPNAGIWGALLAACKIHKNPDLAAFAAEKLSEIEPHKTSNAVLLSNMYAEAGRWYDVEQVRNSVNLSGEDKQPGCSWIEGKNQLFVFVSDNNIRLQSPEICCTLNSLREQMEAHDVPVINLRPSGVG